MYQLVLTTCGTSLLTNSVAPEIAKLVYRHSNAPTWSAIDDPSEREQLQNHAEERRKLLMSSSDERATVLSAELNGLLAWKSRQTRRTSHRVAYLLATDTELGRHTAETVQQWLIKAGWDAQLMIARGLRTDSVRDFRSALSLLMADLHPLLIDHRENGYRIAFNLTGGFKSVNGFLQAIAAIYAAESFYLFETSRELMIVPGLPLSFDPDAIAREHLGIFRRLHASLSVSAEADDCSEIPEILLFRDGDVVALSEWGELIWRNVQQSVYRERVWPSISERVVCLPTFSASIDGLDAGLIEKINRTMDRLAAYAESDGKENLKGLDVKPLQGAQHQGRFECDVDDHHRIFIQPPVLPLVRLEKLGAALHKSKSRV